MSAGSVVYSLIGTFFLHEEAEEVIERLEDAGDSDKPMKVTGLEDGGDGGAFPLWLHPRSIMGVRGIPETVEQRPKPEPPEWQPPPGIAAIVLGGGNRELIDSLAQMQRVGTEAHEECCCTHRAIDHEERTGSDQPRWGGCTVDGCHCDFFHQHPPKQ